MSRFKTVAEVTALMTLSWRSHRTLVAIGDLVALSWRSYRALIAFSACSHGDLGALSPLGQFQLKLLVHAPFVWELKRWNKTKTKGVTVGINHPFLPVLYPKVPVACLPNFDPSPGNSRTGAASVSHSTPTRHRKFICQLRLTRNDGMPRYTRPVARRHQRKHRVPNCQT
ncbi:hypothetical protein Bbelb_158210 [Branchiostoma belcheri]|nr:hypothetical protein Bbelb_158210 [Branchiostoma belcheri]